jgi:hypothetical protein
MHGWGNAGSQHAGDTGIFDHGTTIHEVSFNTHALLAHDGPKNRHLCCRVYSPGYRIEK